MAADARDVVLHHELRPGVRTPLHDEHPKSFGDLVDGHRDFRRVHLARGLERHEGDGGGLVLAADTVEGGTARPAEVGAGRVAVAALVAEHIAEGRRFWTPEAPVDGYSRRRAYSEISWR